MGLGQYNSLGEYCDPHTASSVFLILVHISRSVKMHLLDLYIIIYYLLLPCLSKLREFVILTQCFLWKSSSEGTCTYSKTLILTGATSPNTAVSFP